MKELPVIHLGSLHEPLDKITAESEKGKKAMQRVGGGGRGVR